MLQIVVGEVEDFHIIDENNYLYAKWKKPKSLEECPLNYTLILNDETFTATETHLEEIGEAIPCKKYLGEIFASYLDMKGSNHSINYRTPPMGNNDIIKKSSEKMKTFNF